MAYPKPTEKDKEFMQTLASSLAIRFDSSSWKTYASVSLDWVLYHHPSSSIPAHGRRLADNMGLCVDDEFMATCPSYSVFCNGTTWHAEHHILMWLRGRINKGKWPPRDSGFHSIHLYTHLSPCSMCTERLGEFLEFLRRKDLARTVLVCLRYSEPYTPWKPGTPVEMRTVPGPDLAIPLLNGLALSHPNFYVI